MAISSRRLAATSLAVSMMAAAGPAAAQSKLCVNSAYGVPGTDGKPSDWWTGTFDIDDPRWTGSSGHSLGSVGASHSPVEVRTTWANEGGRDYVYVSWQINVDAANPLSGKHWLYLAFMPPGATLEDPATRLVRVRFDGTPAGAPTYCNDEPTCSEDAIYQQFQREIADPPDGPQNAACGTIISGPKFQLVNETDGALPWLTDTLRFKDEGGRWAVQVRIPVDPTAANLAAGIREDTAVAYQTGLELATSAVAFHRWPRSETAPTHELLCDLTGPDALVIDGDTAWRAINIIGGGAVADPAAADCGNRLRLDSGDIGIRPGAAGTGLTSDFSTSAANTVVARVHNTSGAAIAANALTARFRIANWGAQIAVDGTWDNLPVELPVANPTAEAKNAAIINSGADQDVELTWTLTADQACQYTFDESTDPSTTAAWNARCDTCTIGIGPTATQGARADGSPSTTCLAKRRQHQCMQVELAGADVDFESRSTFRNMDFANLSVYERKATIDTAGLPTQPGQTSHEIFLVVMPRNMPAAVQAQTYEEFIAERAKQLLEQLAAPPSQGDPVPEAPEFESLRRPRLLRPLPGGLELPPIDPQQMDRYPRNVRPVAAELTRLTFMANQRSGVKSAVLVSALANSFSAEVLGELVPTLDVYAYYKASPRGRALVPMTAFSLVTSHDGAIEGLRWALDGAVRLHGNVYKLTIPLEQAREVGVRVQALEPGETPIHEEAPCGGCCRKSCSASIADQLGNAPIPLAFVLLLAAGRLRRRKQQRQA